MAIVPVQNTFSVTLPNFRDEQSKPTCTSSLKDAKRLEEVQKRLNTRGLGSQLHDHAVFRDINHFGAELFREDSNRVQVLMLQAEGLRRWERDIVILGLHAALKILRKSSLALELGVDTRFVEGTTLELIFKIFRTQDRHFGKEEFARDDVGLCVIKDSPYRNLRDTAEYVKVSKSWRIQLGV